MRWRRVLAALALLAIGVWAAFRVSPWLSALVNRAVFEAGAKAASEGLAEHVPADVVAMLDVRYEADLKDPDGRLDVFYPPEAAKTGRALRTIVWVHGGGWVSGSKGDVANYLRILAARGFTTVGVDYSIAPRHRYPTPLRQLDAALRFLGREGTRLHVDASDLVLAGDSAGAQIAAQYANMVSAPDYARKVGIAPALRRPALRGTLLYCGPYDMAAARLGGPFRGWLRSVLWPYTGTRAYATDPRFAPISVVNYVTPAFPPSFISAGNTDPLLPQSRALAKALEGKGVRVETLFFPDDQIPGLPHEYQFDLDTEGGRLALERSVAFLKGLPAD